MKPLDLKSLKQANRAPLAVGLVLLAVAGGLGWWLVGAGAAVKPVVPRLIAVAVDKAVVKDLPYRIEAPGSVDRKSVV